VATGIQIFNDAHTVQIDDTYFNYQLVAKASLASSASGYVRQSEVKITVSGLSSLAAIQTDLKHCVASIASVDANTWSMRIVLDAPAGTSIVVYHFAAKPPASTRCGLQIYDSGGKLRFDAASRFLRVQKVLSGDYRRMLGEIHLPRGRTYASIFSRWAGNLKTEGVTSDTGAYPTIYYYWSAPGVKLTNSKLQISQYSEYQTSDHPWFEGNFNLPPPSNHTYPEFMLMIADVTGY